LTGTVEGNKMSGSMSGAGIPNVSFTATKNN
jgi:hypothetical protein